MLREPSSSHSFARSAASARSTGPHFDRDAVAVGQPRRQRVQHILAARRDDQMVAAGGQLGGQRFADVLRSAGDDGARVGAGCGYWHADDRRQPVDRLGHHGQLPRCAARAGVGAVGLRVDGPERDRRHVRVLGLPHQDRRRGPAGRTRRRAGSAARSSVAGVTVALLAPVTGVWVDVPQRRRRTLGALTATLVLLTSAMSLIRDDPRYLLAGLVLLAFTAACSDLASVPYNAMLRQLATPETSGRISGFGWAAGYVGSMVLLLTGLRRLHLR